MGYYKGTLISRRLAAYSAVAAATAATSGAIDAAEIVHDIPDVTVDTSGFGFLFNMVTGSIGDSCDSSSSSECTTSALGVFHLQPRSNGYIYGPAYPGGAAGKFGLIGRFENYSSSSTSSGGAVVVNTYERAVARPLGTSDPVSDGYYFVGSTSYLLKRIYCKLGFSDGQTGIVGIRFELATGVHYGWAQITRIDSDHFTLHGFGYNNTAGAASTPVDTVVPEPSSLALLALGAAGLAARRKH